jgi:hypothetical protein
MSTGLIDPNEQTTYFLNGRQPGAARQSYVYRANECISEFNRGKFTQTLKGTLNTYYPDQTFKANQRIAQGIQIDTINSLLQGRTNLTSLAGSLSGSLGLNSFFNNIPSVAGLTNSAVSAVGNFANNVLGSSPTRISATPTDPTSSGLPVGSTNDETPILLNQDDAPNISGTEQQMAAGDDSGVGTNGPELLNQEE